MCRFNTEASLFSCSNPSPHQSLPLNTTGRMPDQLFFTLALRHRLHFSSPGFSLALWSSSLRRHDSSLTPHSVKCRENYLFSCCRGVKAKLSWDSRAAQGSPCSYVLRNSWHWYSTIKTAKRPKTIKQIDGLATELWCFNNTYCLRRNKSFQDG